MLPPLALKHFPPEVIEQTVLIYKTALALSYTPCSWLTSRVVFIPKPGKERYTEPKSFRPISLSNYILKGLERVVGWHADAMLDLEPVHTAQHGFTKGRSTESAISNTVNYIEKHIYAGDYCLAVFLDIQGAFDNIDINGIHSSLLAKGINEYAADWYLHYLSNRRLDITQGVAVYSTHLARGFPQGGVLSAKLWTIAFDEVVEIINKSGMFVQAYADDCCLMIGGTDLEFMYRRTNQVLTQLSQCGEAHGLKFNPKKQRQYCSTEGIKNLKAITN
jgi:hypothetical protein